MRIVCNSRLGDYKCGRSKCMGDIRFEITLSLSQLVYFHLPSTTILYWIKYYGILLKNDYTKQKADPLFFLFCSSKLFCLFVSKNV